MKLVMICTLLLNLICLGTSNSNSRMGGSVADFVAELEKAGDLNDEQADFIKQKYPNDDLPYELPGQLKHQNRGNLLDSEMMAYLNEQESSGKLSGGTKQYVSTLLKLHQESPPLNISRPVTADYTENGIVEFLGRSQPSPFVLWAFSNAYRGIWGYATGNREYALLTHTDGLHIVDVTDPSSPFRVQYIYMFGGLLWRDVETYYHEPDGKTYAYVAAQAEGNLFVVDLSLLSRSIPHGEDEAVCPYADLGRKNYGHTLTVREELLFLNSAGVKSMGCQIFDLKANPWDPPLLSNSYNGTQRDCHDSVARNGVDVPGLGKRNLLYSADGSAGRFRIVDITGILDGEIPEILGETGDVGTPIYAHSLALSEDSKYLYVFEETKKFDIGIFNISDPTNITLVRTFSYSDDGAGNAICHNGHIRGNYLFVAYYEAGFRVFDISDPTNPVEKGKYETYRDPDNVGKDINPDDMIGAFLGAWNLYAHLPSGNILVSDQQTGLFILRISDDKEENATEILVTTAPCTDVEGWNEYFTCEFVGNVGCFAWMPGQQNGHTSLTACCSCGGGE